MLGRFTLLRAGIIGVAAIVIAAPMARAQVIADADQRKCFATIAKEGAKYVKTHLKERSKCADKNVKVTGSCDVSKRDAKLAKAETKLKAGIDKKCGDGSSLSDLTLQFFLGFPGRCPDPTGPPFTNDDLETCIFQTHRDIAETLIGLQYGSNGEDAALSFEGQGHDAATAKSLGKCQKEISKNAQKLVKTILKEVQKCRNGLLAGKLTGFVATACADNPVEPGVKEKIDKAEAKMRDKIAGKCTNPLIALLHVCGDQPTEPLATDCLVAGHRDAADNPDQSEPSDLVDVEYVARAFCGDGLTNDALATAVVDQGGFRYGSPPEECDGADDAACPGLCGAPGGDFPCLCLSVPRIKVEESSAIDSDNGWNGITHDTVLLAGAGYTSELFDCDGPGGPDTLCTVGPSCALAPHAPCMNDGECAGGADFCRTGPTASRPHCHEDVTQPCDSNLDCPGSNNFCRMTLTGAPIPVSAGGVSVCTLNILAEDVVGTTDVASGDSEVRLRQRSVSFIGAQDHPCPVCGGFCNEPIESSRTLCSSDGDCSAGVACQLAPVCSSGPNIDLPCRTALPAGGTSTVFGTTSIDCPVGGAAFGALDSATDPRSTGPVTLLPSFACTAVGFTGNACVAGASTGQICVVDSDCPGGGAGSCRGQCFCPAGGTLATQPNACLAACRGGPNDYQSCAADSDCLPGGFCQPGSCRSALGVCVSGVSLGSSCSADSDCPGGTCGDDDSTQEGFCPAGPLDGTCSLTTIKPCTADAECRPPSVGGSCSFCQETETCQFTNRNCFVNEGLTRTGSPSLPVRERASVFCIPSSGNSLIDAGGGFPGPAATEGEENVVITGLAP